MAEKKEFSKKALKDFELINSAINDNDEKAYADLMIRYRKPVYHMILKMIKNRDDAEDLTIEAFAKAFKNLANIIAISETISFFCLILLMLYNLGNFILF